MAKYEELCSQILEHIGGKENVKSAVHCMTRLRIDYVNKDKIDVEAVKGIKGVLGSQFSAGQYQIIIGQQVSNVYPEFCEMAGITAGAAVDENLDSKEPFDIKKVPSKVLDYLSGSIASMIPIMMGTGFFKLFYTLLGPDMLNVFSNESAVMQSIYLVGNAGFYFMPVFVAYGAAKKLNTNIALALLLGVLLVDPNWTNIVAHFAETGSLGWLLTNGYSFPVSCMGIEVCLQLYRWCMSYIHQDHHSSVPDIGCYGSCHVLLVRSGW